MDTIQELERKLALAKQAMPPEDEWMPRVSTGIIIDLQSSQGNVFYIWGLCQKLAHDYLDDWEVDEFNKEVSLNGGKSYQQILDACQRWFGLIYIKSE